MSAFHMIIFNRNINVSYTFGHPYVLKSIPSCTVHNAWERRGGPINGGQVHSLVLEGEYDLTQLTSLQFTLYTEHIIRDSRHCTVCVAPTIVVSCRVIST